ncbi:hypothetical protein RKE25_02535 [Dyella sp. BiH032]|uniref:hypothetical protein n=1 Tax=Dyella sp. BiH032 TaxID=3075430 RepID=UPI002892BEFA|nr:hypothetical protein [Dyella sp. BiH032]WNL46533.1 hypothetical protein RKE25_02535 [Dyella sp. BiH032]
MIAQWLGLPDKRSEWVFLLAILGIAACLVAAVMGPPARRFDLLLVASLTGWLGAHLLNRSWRGLSKRLPELYEERLRSGVRMSFAAKLLSLLCIGLGVIACITLYGG